jgi:plastocyanin
MLAPRRRVRIVGPMGTASRPSPVARLLWSAVVSGALVPVAGVRAEGHDIAITANGCEPAELKVVAGEPVTWTNDTDADHGVTGDDGAFDSGT